MQREFPNYRVGIGQESHRFLPVGSSKPCVLGGLIFPEVPGFAADSDGDVIFHAICNAIASLTGIPILDGIAYDLCHKDGITDSAVYVERALDTLGSQKISHVALSLEGKRPLVHSKITAMRKKIADCLHLDIAQVGLTASSGDGLTDVGCGEGMQCLCVLTTAIF